MIPMKDWPKDELPQNKVCDRGANVCSYAELLSLFLRSTVDKTAVDLARELLFKYGSLRGIFNAGESDFCDQAGVSRGAFAQLKAALELSKRYFNEQIKRGDVLEDPDAVRLFLASRLRELESEVFAVVWLDNRHRVIQYEEMFQGTINSASVHPREVVRRAIHHNAAAVILAHNHPSGVAEPSQSDERITERLREVLALIDVRVLDHLIVGDSIVSFAERGLL